MKIIVIPFATENPVLLKRYFEIKFGFLKKYNDYMFIFVNDRGWLDDQTRNNIFHDVFNGFPKAILLQNYNKDSIKGGAIYTGLAEALRRYPDASHIGYTDIDDSLDLEDAASKLNTFDSSKTDVFLGIRAKRALPDLLCSKAYSLLIKLLYPKLFKIADLHACFKFFSPDFLKEYFSRKKITDITFNFEHDILLFALEKKYKIAQFKVGWEESRYSSGRTLKNIIRAIKAVIRKRFFNKQSIVYKFSKGGNNDEEK